MRAVNDAGLGGKIASAILEGFNHHFTLFKEITLAAKTRFEQADWEGESNARKERIYYYDLRVSESLEFLKQDFELEELDSRVWQDVKRWYLWLLYDHDQPELAESFYNSVFCRLFDSRYYNNDYIFVKPGTAVEFLDLDHPVYTSFYPDNEGLEACMKKVLNSFGLERPWQDIDRDARLLAENMEPALASALRPAPHRQLHVVSSLFFRNKAAYVVGRALIGVDCLPFVIPILINEDMRLYVDTILTEADDLALIFSFTRAYFMVNTQVPSGLISFLQSILPGRTRADLYTSIGFQKQGKTLFYREFLHHLEHSTDKLIIAPGIKGMVMSVFTLPSYPYVFKVIKDRFSPPKEIDRATVKEKYQLVKMHDRVGRMADTLEFSHVAFPAERFSDELLEQLKNDIESSLTVENGFVIIRHLYIERRMVPFNIYLDHADDEMLERGVVSYGNAIKEMIAANIFPGDMLL
ncbi:MAG: bifunctional isocitrate dehydrogenase kinase/phosphatase, partial [bacterium]